MESEVKELPNFSSLKFTLKAWRFRYTGAVAASDSRSFRARSALNPGKLAIASSLASRTPCTLPNSLSSWRRFTGPIPGTLRSSDVTVRIDRRFRL